MLDEELAVDLVSSFFTSLSTCFISHNLLKWGFHIDCFFDFPRSGHRLGILRIENEAVQVVLSFLISNDPERV